MATQSSHNTEWRKGASGRGEKGEREKREERRENENMKFKYPIRKERLNKTMSEKGKHREHSPHPSTSGSILTRVSWLRRSPLLSGDFLYLHQGCSALYQRLTDNFLLEIFFLRLHFDLSLDRADVAGG